MLGRESRRNEGRTRWREGFGPAGVFYGPPVASSARELFMLGGSWGYGPAGIPYGPSRIWVIGVSPHRTGRWWAGMIHSRTSLLCVGPERLNSLVLRGPWARSGSVFYAFLAHSSTRPKCFMRGGQYTLLRPEYFMPRSVIGASSAQVTYASGGTGPTAAEITCACRPQ